MDYDGSLALAVGRLSGGKSTIFFSDDHGVTWTKATTPLADPGKNLFDVSISGLAAVAVGGSNNTLPHIMYSSNSLGTLGADWALANILTDPDDMLHAVTLVGTNAYTTGRDNHLDGTAGQSVDSGESWSFLPDLGHTSNNRVMEDVVYDPISTRAVVVGNKGEIQKTAELNLPPYITSGNGLTNVELSVAENTTAVTDVDATDDDGDSITYAKTGGGADQALFSIDGSGVLTFSSAPDYESPPCATDVFSSGLTCLVQVSATDAAGTNQSDTQMITVTITDDPAENDAPVLTLDGGSASYTENGAAIQVSPTATATDAEDLWNSGTLTVNISANTEAADEISLGTGASVDGAGNVTVSATVIGTVAPTTGIQTNNANLVVTLNGSATAALVQTLVRSVSYRSTSEDPSTAQRTVTLTDASAASSGAQTRTINVTATNDAPVLDNSGTMNLTPIAEDVTNPAGDLVSAVIATSAANAGDPITDADGDPEGIAVIAIDETSPNGNWQYATDGSTWQDIPAVTNSSALLLSADANTRIRFVPDADENGTLTTGISFRAWDATDSNPEGTSGVDVSTNGGTSAYSTAFEAAQIIVTALNDTPVLASIEGSALPYNASDPPTAITATLTTADVDDTNLESATIQITGNLDADDRLALNPDPQNGVSGSYNSGTGILSLTGTSSVANYETALRTGTYENINANPPNNTRTLTFTVNDGSIDSNTQSRNITVTGGAPSISVNPDPIAFGFVAVNTPSTITITVSNSGGSALIINPGGIVSNDVQFVPSTTSLTVPAGASDTFDVQFTPTSGGVKAATLTITSTAPTSPTIVNMTGEGTIHITPSLLDFGNVELSSTNQQQITLTNNTGAAVNLTSITSDNTPAFTVLNIDVGGIISPPLHRWTLRSTTAPPPQWTSSSSRKAPAKLPPLYPSPTIQH